MQNVGSTVTQEGRCFAFPNIYQHLVSPFRLADGMRAGHRKILAFLLVDSDITIPSATTVGPQQDAWMRRAVKGTVLWTCGRGCRLSCTRFWARLDAVASKRSVPDAADGGAYALRADGRRQGFGQLFNL